MTTRLLDMTPEQLRTCVLTAGQPRYRADQLADWVYRKGVTDPARMSNLPPEFAGRFAVLTSRVVRRLRARDGTTKLLLEFDDGGDIETVLIPAGKRATACLSTQVGCAVGCAFCASGLHGFERNLSAGEILQQILHLHQQTRRRPTHVVFMGMGEPLANYEATVAAIRAIVDPARLGISARRVTVSTIGLPGPIRRLAAEDLPVTLAISLHAPNDALRAKLIPQASRAPLAEIIDAAAVFFQRRKREITLEYLLIRGVNDTNVCGEGLARIGRRLRCNVNVIRYNPVPSLDYERPTAAEARAFVERLRRRGASAQLRRSRGLDVDAACGQLRRHAAGRT
jgi:23S rRNA (adenine2503-C2)-methyltransferase